MATVPKHSPAAQTVNHSTAPLPRSCTPSNSSHLQHMPSMPPVCIACSRTNAAGHTPSFTTTCPHLPVPSSLCVCAVWRSPLPPSLPSLPQHIELHRKRYGQQLNHETKKRKREAREVHKRAEYAQKAIGLKVGWLVGWSWFLGAEKGGRERARKGWACEGTCAAGVRSSGG